MITIANMLSLVDSGDKGIGALLLWRCPIAPVVTWACILRISGGYRWRSSARRTRPTAGIRRSKGRCCNGTGKPSAVGRSVRFACTTSGRGAGQAEVTRPAQDGAESFCIDWVAIGSSAGSADYDGRRIAW
jgi:hypothetical protein